MKSSKYDLTRSIVDDIDPETITYSKFSMYFEYSENHLKVDSRKKTFQIFVDDTSEYYEMKRSITEHSEILSRKPYYPLDTPECSDEMEAENKYFLHKFQEKYNIDSSCVEQPKNQKYPKRENNSVFSNILSGAKIDIKIGEGLLDFIYADFENLGRKIEQKSSGQFSAEYYHIRAENHIGSSADEAIDPYLTYLHILPYIREIIFASLYTAICPPVFKPERTHIFAFENYYKHIIGLQRMYKDVITFCFDEELYPNVLGKFSAQERAVIYYRIHRESPFWNSAEEFRILPVISDTTDRCYDKQELQRFSEEYDIDISDLERYLKNPFVLDLSYPFRSADEILSLEFAKMLELDIKFRRCKYCNRFFLLRGNHDAHYCNTVAPGETRTCQEIMSQQNYKARAEEEPALKLYSKYYKRYAARVRSNRLKEGRFKKWSEKALLKRNECLDGTITLQEFTDWLEDSFPNRKRKTQTQT